MKVDARNKLIAAGFLVGVSFVVIGLSIGAILGPKRIPFKAVEVLIKTGIAEYYRGKNDGGITFRGTSDNNVITADSGIDSILDGNTDSAAINTMISNIQFETGVVVGNTVDALGCE